MVDALAVTYPRIAAVGFSLGGSLALLALGRNDRAVSPALRAVAAVCPPLDLAACAGALDRPGNRLYRRYFMKKLRLSYRRRQRLRPDLYAARLERGLVTIRDFDQVITAHYGGFRHADDYYAARAPAPSSPGSGGPPSSSPPWTIPSCPPTRWPAGRCHPPVRREILSTGGHVGFVAPTRAPGFFWAAERVLHELEAWI